VAVRLVSYRQYLAYSLFPVFDAMRNAGSSIVTVKGRRDGVDEENVHTYGMMMPNHCGEVSERAACEQAHVGSTHKLHHGLLHV
jgi:hypothetical protein